MEVDSHQYHIEEAIKYLYQSYARKFDKAEYEIYVRHAMSCDPVALKKAIDEIVLDSQWFPKWAQIQKIVGAKSHINKGPSAQEIQANTDYKKAMHETKRRSEDAALAMENLKQAGIENDDIKKYVHAYVARMGMNKTTMGMFHLDAGAFKEMALADLFRSNMDTKRALLKAIPSSNS